MLSLANTTAFLQVRARGGLYAICIHDRPRPAPGLCGHRPMRFQYHDFALVVVHALVIAVVMVGSNVLADRATQRRFAEEYEKTPSSG